MTARPIVRKHSQKLTQNLGTKVLPTYLVDTELSPLSINLLDIEDSAAFAPPVTLTMNVAFASAAIWISVLLSEYLCLVVINIFTNPPNDAFVKKCVP